MSRSNVRLLVPSSAVVSLFGIERIEISATHVTLREVGRKPLTVPRSKISAEKIKAENVFTLADAVKAVRS